MTTTDNDDNDKSGARRRTIVFLSAAQQQKDFFQNKHCEFCQQMPWKSFARKNIGYLYAIQHGAKAIFDFDDDNVLQNFTKNGEIVDSVSSSQEDQSQQPFSPFSMLLDASSSIHVRFLRDEQPGDASTNATTTSHKSRPFNPFPLMYPSEAEVWPRGFPLSEIKDPFLSGQHPRTTMYEGKLPLSNVAVLQSVCDGDPDVDATYRLTRPLPVHFDTTVSPLLVPSLSYVPYNAQATIHLEQAFWALLLPFTVAGRVTDIWRSYFSERLFHELGLSVVYTPPMVTHNRNAHEYMADWEAEHDLYHKTSALLTFLNEWQPDVDVKNSTYLPVHLEELWIALYERDYIGLQDVSSMQHWLAALEGIGYVFPSLRRETPGTLSIHGVDDAIIESHPSKLLAFPKVEAPVRKKKWAVLMIGGARTYAVCRESITKNVLLQTDPPMDMFTYSFHHQNQSCHLDNLGLDILDRDSKMIHYDDAFVKYEATSREASYDRFVRQQVEHFQMLQQYQTKHNVTYDYVLYARPDLFFLEPFDFQAIEKILDEPRTNGTYAMFSPACCRFRGICDRIAATTYEGYSNMMRLTEAWHENATHLIGEEAFRERAAFAKMERFDVVGTPHAFATVRNSNVGKICQGTEDIGASWTDYVCFARGQSSFLPLLQRELRPSTCAIYNSSNCPDR
jgi:STELLO glycosyltransferases